MVLSALYDNDSSANSLYGRDSRSHILQHRRSKISILTSWKELINKMKDLQKNSEYGEKKGQYPTESRSILTDAIDDANRSVLLWPKYQNPVPSEQEKQRYVASAKSQLISLRVLFVRKC